MIVQLPALRELPSPWATRVRQRSTCRHSLIHEGPGLRSLQIAGFDGIDFEPGAADQVIHLAIEVTASADQLPIWRQTMLPPSNADFRREAVLDENQSPARPENPPHVGERRDRIRDRAQGQVITIVSNTASATGRSSAEARSNDTGMTTSAARLLASRSNSGDGSRPTTRVTAGP
jgi:hypothetical protein